MSDHATGEHEALGVFVGDWHAGGHSFGGDAQTPQSPRAAQSPWVSVHRTRWHSGGFFVVQDERANGPFDTLSVMGWDRDAGRYFCRTVDNLGFARDYTLHVDGPRWALLGEHERATIEFSDDDRTQTISWEWRPQDGWLPLCDRVARRVS